METRKNVLTTTFGSRLYGLHTETSDYDTYTVYTDPNTNSYKAKHKINGLEDDFTVTLPKFMTMCNAGVPQALEALFSPYKEINPNYAAFLNGYRVDLNEARMRYRRTIKSFGFIIENNEIVDMHPEFKKRRHAYRLILNLNDLMVHRRFNSAMAPKEIEYANYGASLNYEDHYSMVMEDMGLAQIGELHI